MKNIFDGFDKTDDEIIDLASAHYHAPQSEKDRVFAMTERRLNNMKKDSRIGSRPQVERMDVGTSVRRFPFAAAACITALVVGAGVFALVNNVKPIDVAARDEQIKYLPGTADSAKKASSFTASAADREDDVSASDNKNEKIIDSRPESKAESKTAKKVSSGKAESEYHGQSDYPQEISPADVTVHQEADDANVSSSPDAEVEVPSSSAGVCTVGEDESEVISYGEGDSEEVPAERVYEYERGVTHSDIVLSVTPDMTYRQVIDRLGEPETYEQNGYAQFIMDGDKLLMLVYDDENYNIGISGEDLAASAYPLNEMYSNKDERTFDAFIIKQNEKGDAFFVVCPQYDFFDCAYVRARSIDKFEIDLIDWLPPYQVRIKHADAWEESYPVGVDAESIDFYK